jgi:hypothetical protein
MVATLATQMLLLVVGLLVCSLVPPPIGTGELSGEDPQGQRDRDQLGEHQPAITPATAPVRP